MKKILLATLLFISPALASADVVNLAPYPWNSQLAELYSNTAQVTQYIECSNLANPKISKIEVPYQAPYETATWSITTGIGVISIKTDNFTLTPAEGETVKTVYFDPPVECQPNETFYYNLHNRNRFVAQLNIRRQGGSIPFGYTTTPDANWFSEGGNMFMTIYAPDPPPPTCPEGYTGTYPDCVPPPPPEPEMNTAMQYGLNLILIAIGLWFAYSFTRATVNVTGKGLAEARNVRKETKELKKKREKGLL